MKTKFNINENAICEYYKNNQCGVDEVAKVFKIGKKRVREILAANGVERRKRGGQVLNEQYIVPDYHIEKFRPIEGEHYVAIDKESGFQTKDYMNSAGVLTSHIKEVYKIEIPTLYDRRLYYMRTGNYWWEQWFDIVSVKDAEVKKCPYCNWTTIDLENRSGMFETHLLKAHGITKLEYLKVHPEDRDYFASVKPSVQLQMEEDADKFVECAICGQKFARLTNSHLQQHGLTQLEYIHKYQRPVVSKDYHERISKIVIEENKNREFRRQSSAEIEIIEFLRAYGIKVIEGERHILNDGKEIDIYLPDYKLGIEYNGNLWHSEKYYGVRDYHINKLVACNKAGVRLIHIFEDEYQYHRDLVLNKLLHIIGITTDKQRIGARKCHIETIPYGVAVDFLEKHHIQGKVSATLYYGALYENKLVAVMCFLDNGHGRWTLTRFATDGNMTISGMASKMFKYFQRENPNYIDVISFADRRWTTDGSCNMYTKLGFELDSITPPDYRYFNSVVDKYKRFHKFNFRKQLLHKKYGLSLSLTEHQMTERLGFTRIWDCGLFKYIYRNPDIKTI